MVRVKSTWASRTEAQKEAQRVRCRERYKKNRDKIRAQERERMASDPAYREHRRKLAEDHARRHPERKQYKRGLYIKKKYGLTLDALAGMVAERRGLCDICGDVPDQATGDCTGTLHTDHNHKTGVVRGLLCYRCNIGIGMMRDRPELLRAAAEYIERARALEATGSWCGTDGHVAEHIA